MCLIWNYFVRHSREKWMNHAMLHVILSKCKTMFMCTHHISHTYEWGDSYWDSLHWFWIKTSLLLSVSLINPSYFLTGEGLQMKSQQLQNSSLKEIKTQGSGAGNWMKLSYTLSFSGLTSFYDNANWKMGEEEVNYRAGLTKCLCWVLNSLLLHLCSIGSQHQASGYSTLTRLLPS